MLSSVGCVPFLIRQQRAGQAAKQDDNDDGEELPLKRTKPYPGQSSGGEAKKQRASAIPTGATVSLDQVRVFGVPLSALGGGAPSFLFFL